MSEGKRKFILTFSYNSKVFLSKQELFLILNGCNVEKAKDSETNSRMQSIGFLCEKVNIEQNQNIASFFVSASFRGFLVFHCRRKFYYQRYLNINHDEAKKYSL